MLSFVRLALTPWALFGPAVVVAGGREAGADPSRRDPIERIVRIDRPRAADLPPAIARELRGAWVSPLDAMTGPDWPSRAGLSPEDQRTELRVLLDHARAIGLNAIVLHVRTAADALYPSDLVPW